MAKRSRQFDLAGGITHRPLEREMLNRQWLRLAITCAGETFLSCLVWPRFVAPYRWQLRREPMAFPRLPAEFSGYRVALICDLHVGRTRQHYLRRVFEAVTTARPDVILVGGDLIDYDPESLPLLAELLPLLQARDGVWTIFGNHDYCEYSWRHNGIRSAHRAIHKRLVALLAESPWRLLRNELAVIHRGPARLQIVGIDEMWADRADPAKAFAAVDPDMPTICLQHNPDGFELVRRYPWHWLLCGHSHGGQVRFPGLGALYVPMEHHDRLRGLHHFPEAPGKTVYISSGIGYSRALRMRVRPEVVVFELTAS